MAPLIIKVCGMTEAENIRNVEQLDVDMIGFIFYPKSPRCLCEIPAYLPVRAKRVGVDGALLYSQKGDKMEGLDMKQSGLDIPVNLKYSIGLGSMLGIYVAAGPDFFFNFKGDKNFEDGRKLESKKAQVGINVGAGVKLVRHLQIGFNYTIPCGDSFTWKSASEAIGTKNKTWQISAAYLF